MKTIIAVVTIFGVLATVCLCQNGHFIIGPENGVLLKDATFDPIRAGQKIVIWTNGTFTIVEYGKPTEPCRGTIEILNASAQSHIEKMKLDGSITNVIDMLLSSGEFCRIHGHVWGEHNHVTLEYMPDRIGCRECKICGLHQNRFVTDWK